jgi:mRNA interferase YafQ
MPGDARISTGLSKALVRIAAPGPRHRDHPLQGEWQDCRDCHIRGDVVLIYSLPPGLAVFHRVGSHSELFRR